MAHNAAPLGVGIVGLSANGGWAARGHLPALSAAGGYELRALTASSPESARKAAAAFGLPDSAAGTDAGALAARDDIDVVVVTVRVPRHRELILPLLRAGKTVLSEWPLGNGLAEADELAALAAESGTRTAVGLQARSAPVVRYLRDLVADGYVGEVLSTTLVGSGGGWGPAVQERSAYVADRANGATMLTVPFGHTLDALTMVLSGFDSLSATTATRRPEVRVTETGASLPMTAEDQIAVTGQLSGGAVASLHYRGGSSRGTNFLWEINGTEGDLVVTGGSGHLQFGQVELHGSRGEEAEPRRLTVPESYELVPGLDGPAGVVANAYVQLRTDLTEGTSLVPDFAHAAAHHRLLDRITTAARTGTRA
ncbi:Gfo/Idh/MocA family protein [Streptomyces iconiensis]|uniref:Gfo/Idh/MocA family oxidoreductase n=1 Tax=Streptomyces iconiensis TaxID=1384038 RepID=A0ABT6ZSJ6_9ACTN|nr:Gfo/Idh/MocA family oxidoreductase [Streptomyces iconiensis]MDJ1132038.1 Gfo/Idh/MocA family oxidoreductase [Streptomyces iconiensis]